MKINDKKWSSIKEILFAYLAINKIIYWINFITDLNQSELRNMREAVLMRLLTWDLQLILGVIAFFYLDKLIELKKSKYSNIVEYSLFYIKLARKPLPSYGVDESPMVLKIQY